MKRIGSGLAVMAAVVLLSGAAPAQADDWGRGRDYGYDRDGRGDSARRRGYEQGQEDGRREGWSDARSGERARWWDSRDYREGDSGYRRHYGPRHEYVQAYRQGYEQAYREAYSRFRERRGDRRDRW